MEELAASPALIALSLFDFLPAITAPAPGGPGGGRPSDGASVAAIPSPWDLYTKAARIAVPSEMVLRRVTVSGWF